jgi:ABC-type dipeptide/oligopeptide/nickel transport system ATPase component
MSEALLKIRDLHTYFGTKDGVVKAVDGVSLELQEDSVLGLVGESGSGKTVTALSVFRIVPFPGNVVGGSIVYEGTNLLNLGEEEMRQIRGKEISLIFQDVGSALNPVMPIGTQVEEIMLEHTDMSESEARSLAVDLLAQTGIAEARRILDQYPFQLSGGMGQRVMMAIGIALKPKVLIADEPTSNLDVTMQAELLQRLKQLQAGSGTAIMLITHDMGVIAQMAETVAVMYGGTVVEYTDTQTLFARPLHPYT